MNTDGKGIWTVLIATVVIFIGAGIAVKLGVRAQDIALIGFIAFGSIIVLFAGAVLYQIGVGKIQLHGIIAEPKGTATGDDDKPKASLSRFQFLIFTFVVAGLFLMLSIEAGQFVNIPENVLVLIGLSGTGYLVGKATNKKPEATPPAKTKKAAAAAEEAEAAATDSEE